MPSASSPPAPEPDDLVEGVAASDSILTSQVEDLERELNVVRKKAHWHLIWTLLGVSPAAILPALGLMREGSWGLLVLLAVLVTVQQGYLGAKASKRVEQLEAQLANLRKEEHRPFLEEKTQSENLDSGE